MTALAAMIERLEKADKPDKKLWTAAYEAIHGKQTISLSWGRFLVLIDAAAWLDAAMMLVPSTCKGYWLDYYCLGQDEWEARALLSINEESQEVGNSDTLPLALCIAALKARLADTTAAASPVRRSAGPAQPPRANPRG